MAIHRSPSSKGNRQHRPRSLTLREDHVVERSGKVVEGAWLFRTPDQLSRRVDPIRLVPSSRTRQVIDESACSPCGKGARSIPHHDRFARHVKSHCFRAVVSILPQVDLNHAPVFEP